MSTAGMFSSGRAVEDVGVLPVDQREAGGRGRAADREGRASEGRLDEDQGPRFAALRDGPLPLAGAEREAPAVVDSATSPSRSLW
jgi:hypothetical protein